MRCEDTTAHLADYLAGTLGDRELQAIREHMAGCAACRDEFAALDDTWQMLGTLPAEPADSAAMRARFDAVLAGYAQGRGERLSTRVRHFAGVWWRPRLALQGLAAAAVLMIGVAIGRQLDRPPAPPAASIPDSQLAALRHEIGEMREMVSLSLLQHQSATDRLQGVAWTGRVDQPGNEVVAALLDTLMHDPNVNVRLASIDALERFADRDVVRRGALKALPEQTSPLVQIALIDFAVESVGADSAGALRVLSENTATDADVRTHAARRLGQLGAKS
jgi:hypothetical protein